MRTIRRLELLIECLHEWELLSQWLPVRLRCKHCGKIIGTQDE